MLEVFVQKKYFETTVFLGKMKGHLAVDKVRFRN